MFFCDWSAQSALPQSKPGALKFRVAVKVWFALFAHYDGGAAGDGTRLPRWSGGYEGKTTTPVCQV